MGLLFLIGLGALVYLLARGSNHAQPEVRNTADSLLDQRNREWVQFISGYLNQTKTKAERAVVLRMLQDLELRGIAVPEYEQLSGSEQLTPTKAAAASANKAHLIAMAEEEGMDMVDETSQNNVETSTLSRQHQVQLDNASLLLYFGAFLFVASAGLFVAFGGLPGTLRTTIVLVVTLAMYASGLWIYNNRTKLQQVGLTFGGIGLAIAPLCGLAAYNYVFNQGSGAVVWFVTSLFCLALYVHALFTLRKPLLTYLFIFTLLSLFESGVSIVSAPVYYFGWVMSVMGIGLTWFSYVKGIWPEMQESTAVSSRLFLPIALLLSLVLIPGQGVMQFGVSLLLAGLYYGLQAYVDTVESSRIPNMVASQVAVLGGVSTLVYAVNHSLVAAAWTLGGMTLLELVIIRAISRQGLTASTFATVAIGGQLAAVFLSIDAAVHVLALVGLLVVACLVVWQRQQRVDAYITAMVAWISLPLIYGQFVSNPHLGGSKQAVIMLAALAVQLGLLLTPERVFDAGDWKKDAQHMFIVSSIVVLIASLWAEQGLALVICGVVSFVALFLAEQMHDRDWGILAGIFMLTPLSRGWSDNSVFFLGAVVVALLVNIAISLRYRAESSRWVSTALWLLLPLAMGQAHVIGVWGLSVYAWAYVLAAIGLLLSRSIARGVIYASSRAPIASYTRNASVSYVVGYGLALIGAGSLALTSTVGKVQGTAILVVITLLLWAVARIVEKQPPVYALLPIAVQFVLFSAIRPGLSDTAMLTAYLVMSSAAAVALYLISATQPEQYKESMIPLAQGALLTSFLTPAAIFVSGETSWPMPIGLFIAAGMLYRHVRTTNQNNRELVGGLALISIWWLMWFAGVRNIQAYSHVLVALLALYAYIRHGRGEEQTADQYITFALATATIPLALQAFSGVTGGIYGWWLLLEQIVIMLIGMSINKHFVTMWGLYVALGAVLYQLRNLGWAALTVLALFVIGFAVYKLQKIDK